MTIASTEDVELYGVLCDAEQVYDAIRDSLVPADLLAGTAELARDLFLTRPPGPLGEDLAAEDRLPSPADLGRHLEGALFGLLVAGEGCNDVGHVGWHSLMVARVRAASPVCIMAT